MRIATQQSNYASAAESGDRSRPATSRPVILGTECVVSSGHWLTTLAATRILLAGGNAFDATVAAVFAAAVVEPTSSFSLGAESVFMIHEGASGRTRSLCGQGGAARRATPEAFLKKGYSAIPTGPGLEAALAFTTPGVVGALTRLLKEYGSRSIVDVLAPAIQYAEQGFPCYDYMTSRLSDVSLQQLKNSGSAAQDIFYPNGVPATSETIIKQPSLASTLKRLSAAADGCDREEGIKRARALFYEGELAKQIASASERLESLLRYEDMVAFQEDYETPSGTEFRGYTVECQSFWSQAPVVLQALNILEKFDLESFGFNSPRYIHVVAESLKLAFADREAHYADPKFSPVPADTLLSKDYASKRALLVNLENAYSELPVSGLELSGRETVQPAPHPLESSEPEYGTTHISIVDRHNNVVVATPSGGAFGKSIFLDDLGFTISTRSEMLNLDANHPNCVAPGKRPRTTLVNYLAKSEGGDIYSFGCPGGDGQAQAVLQIILNTFVWKMDPQQAVEAPRFATNSMPNSFYPHAYFPGRLSVEAGISEETEKALRDLGHEVVRAATCGMGAIVTKLDKSSSVRSTSSDPRRPSHAMGW